MVFLGQFQNSTLEERVELLEGQVVVLQDEVSDIEANVNFLFDETIIQDQRIFSLEQISIDVDAQLDIIDDTLEGIRRKCSQRRRIAQKILPN